MTRKKAAEQEPEPEAQAEDHQGEPHAPPAPPEAQAEQPAVEDAKEPEAGTALDFGTRLERLEIAMGLLAGAQVHEIPGLAELLAK